MVKLLLLLFSFTSFFIGDDRYLHWKAGQRLVWEDFQGPAELGTEMQAHTNSRINYSWKCDGGIFLADVEAVFDREKSWKKETLSDKLLAHEQLHFDITELHARMLRRVFADEVDACALSPDAIKEMASAVRARWKTQQDMYDLDSDHGRDQEGQDKWMAKITAGMEKLAEFGSE